MSRIENDHVLLYVKDGIIYEIFKQGVFLDLKATKEIVRDRLKLSNKITMPIYIDFRNVEGTDKEAMDYFDTPESTQYLKDAVILLPKKSFLLKYFLTLYETFYRKGTIKTSFFTDEKKALDRIKNLKLAYGANFSEN